MDRPGFPRAGGFLLAVAILAGAAIGAWAGQASIGVLAGLAVGAIAVIAVWLLDRR